VLAFALAALAAAALLGCIERPPKATMTADDPAGRAQCFANQQSVEDAVHVALINDPGKNMPANYGQVKSLGFVKELSWCPAGGNMIWVPTEGGFMDCDVHGRWQDQPAQ
jgi:hypothetical protein